MPLHEDLLRAVSRHAPGLETYAPVLETQEGFGYGRLRAAQEGIIFQHLLVLRRTMCQEAALNFYAVQEYAEKKLKRQKLPDLSPLASILLIFALTVEKTQNDTSLWSELRDMLT